jgi:hypothetical protein
MPWMIMTTPADHGEAHFPRCCLSNRLQPSNRCYESIGNQASFPFVDFGTMESWIL